MENQQQNQPQPAKNPVDETGGNTAVVAKKKPGRPRKKVPTVQVETHGVVDVPQQPDNILEIVYSNPSLFKKILTTTRQYESNEVYISFTPREIIFRCKDHLGKTSIISSVDGDKLNWHYCKEPIHICVKRDPLEKIFGTLYKNHYKITFQMKDNNRSSLFISVKDIEYDSDDIYELEIPHRYNEVNGFEDINADADYPVKFTFSSKYFKKKINDVEKLSAHMIIRKYGDEPLELLFPKSKKKVSGQYVFNNNDKIKLQSKIAPDDYLSVSVLIEHIRPFSNSNIGESVIISADKNDRLSMCTYLDRKDNGYAAVIKIYTEIIKMREE